MNDQPFEIILGECLDAVLSGERSIAECLVLYPEHADELKPVLQVALLTTRLKKPEMDAGRIDALEMRLRGQMPAPRREPVLVNFMPLTKLAAMIAIAFLCALGVGGGAVAASANSLPGDTLYGVKRWWEAIILVLASLFDQSDDVWLHLAQVRLDEAEDLARRGIFYREILVDVYDATAQAMTQADADTAPRVIAFLDNAEARLQNLPTTAATEPVRADLLRLVISADKRFSPALNEPPVAASPTATDTLAPTVTPVLTDTPTTTNRPTITLTPTSRVPVTPSRTPSPTVTPTPTMTPSLTPTSTWTPLPLPVLPTSGSQRLPTQDSGSRPAPTESLPTSDATVRYRDTQAAVYATQTAQAAAETQEAGP